MDQLSELIYQLLCLIISIPLEIKEYIHPTPVTPSDFIPIDRPVYRDECFYLKFHCRKFQKKKTNLVIEYWNKTYYIDHDDKFVFVESIYDDSPWSLLTIKFRPKKNTTTIINNFYNSNVTLNTQTTQYNLTQLNKLNDYIYNCKDLDTAQKKEYTSTISDIKNRRSTNKNILHDLWEFFISKKDDISLVADIFNIISIFISIL